MTIGTDTGAQLESYIVCPGIKRRDFSTPIKVVPSKLYTVVIQERLEAKWRKKIERDGWTTDKNAKVLGEPMLLHHWDEYSDRIDYPCIVQPKYNGIRATWKFDAKVPDNSQLLSRKRKQFSCPTLEAQLKALRYPVDGELWAEGKELEDISSMVSHGDKDLKFIIFDLITNNMDLTYPERMQIVIERIADGYYPNLMVVPIAVAGSKQEVEAFAKSIKKLPGTDGTVVRNTRHPYEFNVRSYDILKVKDIISKEYTCIGMTRDEDILGPLAKMLFQCPDTGFTFEYSPNRSKPERVQMYAVYSKDASKYEGHTYTLEFREYTKKGLPRHIISMTERNYE